MKPSTGSAGGALRWASAGGFALVAIGLMFAVPLLQPRHTNPLTAFYSEWAAFILGCVALFGLAHPRYWAPLRLPRIALLPLLLAAVIAVQFVVQRPPYLQADLLPGAYLLWAAALSVLAFAIREEIGLERVATFLAWCVLASACVNSLAAILQHYEWRGMVSLLVARKLGHQVYGNLGQPNHFADAVALGIASAIFLQSAGKLRATVAGLLYAAMLFVIALSGSRSPWLYFLGMAVCAAIAHRKQRTPGSALVMRLTIVMLPGLLLAEWIAALPWLAPNAEYTTGLDRLFSLASTSSERLQLWQAAWHMFLEHPVLGVGWSNFAWTNFMLATSLPGVNLQGLYGHSHNIILHLLAVTGVVGAAVLIVMGGLWLATASRLLDSAAGWWVYAAALLPGIHSMFEYPLWNAYFLGIIAVLLGLGEMRAFTLEQANVARAMTAAFVSVVAVASIFVMVDYGHLETGLAVKYAGDDRQTQIRAHQEFFLIRDSVFASPYVDLVYATDIPLNMDGIKEKIAFTRRAMEFAPVGLIAYRHAALLAIGGEPEEAYAMLDRAVVTYPRLLDEFAAEFEQSATGNVVAQRDFSVRLASRAKRATALAEEQSVAEKRH